MKSMALTVGDVLFVDTNVLLALVTQNPEDFAPFDEIALVDMTEVVEGQ